VEPFEPWDEPGGASTDVLTLDLAPVAGGAEEEIIGVNPHDAESLGRRRILDGPIGQGVCREEQLNKGGKSLGVRLDRLEQISGSLQEHREFLARSDSP
jgi:hypothetical protein